MVIQQRLSTQLQKLLPGADNRSLLLNIRESLDSINMLQPSIQKIVRECYATSVRAAFLMSFGISIGAILCACLVREKKLPK
jgi:hypothetical protein